MIMCKVSSLKSNLNKFFDFPEQILENMFQSIPNITKLSNCTLEIFENWEPFIESL